jgi:carbon-monoxide dehydrogenase iron sulfur subunit
MGKREGKQFPVLLNVEKCTGCRMCQLACSFRHLGEFNPLKAYIVVNRNHGVRTIGIEFTEECTWCGDCAHFCAYGALELKKSLKEKV